MAGERGFSYFGNRYPTHARDDLRAMAGAGATFVVHVMTEEDLAWNPGTIRDLVAATHRQGMTAWLDSWGAGGVFGGEAASYAVMAHPGACQKTNLGKHQPARCPRQPALRDPIARWLDAAVASDATIVLWDEPHLFILRPQRSDLRWSCRCARCRRAFLRRHGVPMPTL
ncbi:MAG: hypothetical protein AVDCRST_MAG73-3226 [uncultured Thermomicrobiales bacterium]|uniref:Uncharacterized protein n=1 Tax=uncultured Thermomicrobiales bacterium TaxID=1645740 RepID=A0A6J4USR5_9BACT|nr:MAG: hypothetical protein AVDCRST_MAG73-3226 [uncultured Thermomicrobiales bacterium]